MTTAPVKTIGKHIGNFLTDLEVGKVGERATCQYLHYVAPDCDIDDVSKVPMYQKKDIDFLVTLDNTTTPIEVKTANDRSYKAHTFEVIANTNKQSPGAVYASQAAYMVYWSTELDRLYFYDLPLLSQFVREHERAYRKSYIKNKTYWTVVSVIPRLDLVNAGILDMIVQRQDDGITWRAVSDLPTLRTIAPQRYREDKKFLC